MCRGASGGANVTLVTPFPTCFTCAMTSSAATPPSVLRELNLAAVQLDRLLTELNVYSRAESSLRAIASAVVDAANRAPAVAIAAIVLNQIGGRYAIRHCIDTAVLTALVAQAAGQARPAVLSATGAALTMNVGMLRDIDALHARASVLDDAERARIRRHPVDGAALLRCVGVDEPDWIDGVLQHHEAVDGSGYPQGLRGADIAVNAALVGMADRYCACIGARNYRRSMLPPAALQMLVEDNAAHPQLVAAFRRVLGRYPPGTLVRLRDGCLGVVSTMVNTVLGATPSNDAADAFSVHLLRGPDGAALAGQRSGAGIDSALHEDQARLRFAMQAVWGEAAAL